jgi:hypothetical protein
MKKATSRALAVVGAAAVLVVGFDAATYAATGSSLLMGRINTANKTTVVKNTGSGPAMSLLTKSAASAPFKTNAKGRVANLNADKVDGLEAAAIIAAGRQATTLGGSSKAQILTAAKTTTSVTYRSSGGRSGNTTYQLPSVPAGTYLVTIAGRVSLNTAGSAGSPNTLTCTLGDRGVILFGTPGAWAQATVTSGSLAHMAGSQVVTFAASELLDLGCSTTAGDGWATSSGSPFFIGYNPIEISFVKLDTGSTAALPVAP